MHEYLKICQRASEAQHRGMYICAYIIAHLTKLQKRVIERNHNQVVKMQTER